MKKHLAIITTTLIAVSPIRAKADNPGTLMKDVNFDGIINAVDASMVLSEYARTSAGNEPTFTETQRYVADTDYDGQVTAIDASCILSEYALRSAGKETATETVLFSITENGHEIYKALTIDTLDTEYGITAEITIYQGKEITKTTRIIKE